MTRNILVLSVLFFFNCVNADITLQFPRTKGPLSHECIKGIFEHYPDQTIIITYAAHLSFLTRVQAALKGDYGQLANLGWICLKNGVSFALMPTTLTYFLITYGIYRTYKLVRLFRHKLPTSGGNTKKSLEMEIDALLYKKVRRRLHLKKETRALSPEIKQLLIEERKKMFNDLQFFLALTSGLEFMGIRNMFLHNEEYDEFIKEFLKEIEPMVNGIRV